MCFGMGLSNSKQPYFLKYPLSSLNSYNFERFVDFYSDLQRLQAIGAPQLHLPKNKSFSRFIVCC